MSTHTEASFVPPPAALEVSTAGTCTEEAPSLVKARSKSTRRHSGALMTRTSGDSCGHTALDQQNSRVSHAACQRLSALALADSRCMQAGRLPSTVDYDRGSRDGLSARHADNHQCIIERRLGSES